MAKNRYAGKAALVTVNANGDTTTFITVGLARNITPPPKTHARIDATGMEDTTANTIQGIEDASEFTFQAIWDADDATDVAIQTLYGSGDQVEWRVTLTDGTNTWVQDFMGIVFDIVPQQFSGTDPVTYQVVVLRNGAVSHTFTP